MQQDEKQREEENKTNQSMVNVMNKLTNFENITSICYCTANLERNKNPHKNLICGHCYVTISNDDESIYECPEENCIYKQTSRRYIVCMDCFSQNSYNENMVQDRNSIIQHKFLSSTAVIS